MWGCQPLTPVGHLDGLDRPDQPVAFLEVDPLAAGGHEGPPVGEDLPELVEAFASFVGEV